MTESGVFAGPWDRAFWFSLPFSPRSKSNFRRQGGSRTWTAERAFERDVTTLATVALPSGWVPGSLDVSLSSRPVMVVAIVARSPLDTANLSKSVLDAMEGVVYANDAQVRAQVAISERHRTNQCALVAVAALPALCTLSDLADAQSSLAIAAVTTFQQ